MCIHKFCKTSTFNSFGQLPPPPLSKQRLCPSNPTYPLVATRATSIEHTSHTVSLFMAKHTKHGCSLSPPSFRRRTVSRLKLQNTNV